ncbi:hypothetical protein [Reyranella sp.]|uniref:hypothetical protein n=1 Tax=Reyranella sp. TaxID=1929291 RepID=UPI003C7E85CC
MVRRLGGLLVLGLMASAFAAAPPAGAQTRKIGTFGGWDIAIVHDKGRFVSCVADTTGADNEGLRLSFDEDGRRHFILAGPPTSGARDEVVVVLQPSGRRFTFPLVQRSPDRLWSPVLENDFTDPFFASKLMEVLLPARNVTRRFDLGDPDTMSARIDGCVASRQ